MGTFNDGLSGKGTPEIKTYNDLIPLFLNNLNTWKLILESHDPHIVTKEYAKWVKAEGPCKEFLSTIVTCVDLYKKLNPDFQLQPYKDDASFIYANQFLLEKIPPLKLYMGTAYALARQMFLLEPGMKKVLLALIEAMEKIFPGTTQ